MSPGVSFPSAALARGRRRRAKKSWDDSSGFHVGISRRWQAGLNIGAIEASTGGEARMDAPVTTPGQCQARVRDSRNLLGVPECVQHVSDELEAEGQAGWCSFYRPLCWLCMKAMARLLCSLSVSGPYASASTASHSVGSAAQARRGGTRLQILSRDLR
jgi:hypothetical protein